MLLFATSNSNTKSVCLPIDYFIDFIVLEIHVAMIIFENKITEICSVKHRVIIM